MKDFHLSTFLGLCVLGICIFLGLVFSGWVIAHELPDTTQVPDSLAMQLIGQENQDFGDYLSQRQAAYYLGIRESDLLALMERGELEGVYTTIEGDAVLYNIYSKSALQKWIDARLEEG